MIKINRFTRIAGLTAILSFSPIALAGHHHGGMHGKYYENLTEELDLNEQQQQLLATSREQMMAEKQKKRQLRQQLKTIVHSDSYDAAAVEKIADQMATATREQIIQHGATMNEFYRSLNPEQRSTLQDMEQQRATKMKAPAAGAK
jgi:Spy/CpxP family protein refolding chaperone